MRRTVCIAIVAAALLGSCHEKAADQSSGIANGMEDSPTEVMIETLKPTTFAHEIISNGKIMARQQADLRFISNSDPIAVVMVENGSHVRKGQVIAKLATAALESKLRQARSSVEQAELEMKDILIGQGYNTNGQSEIPDNVLKLAQIKSGYTQHQAAYELARIDLGNATLKAPFDGVVANLTAKPYSLPDASLPVCRIIATGSFSAEFSILETELQILQLGSKVVVTPYAMPEISVNGTVTEINPLVDEKGMVKIRAGISGDKRLFEGMNVRVRIQRSIPNQYVVPKTAVVLRTGRQVMFTLEDGKAVWNYVTTGLENLDSYTVTGESLKEGMQVITGGNQNLAHHSPVRVVKQPKKE